MGNGSRREAGGQRLNIGEAVERVSFDRVGPSNSNFRWAIIEDQITSQSRFESKEAAQIAFRNHTLGRN